MLFKRHFILLAMLGLLLPLLLLVHCSPAPQTAAKPQYINHNDTVKYVGSAVCKGCHADIFESFSHTGMGQSFGLANKQKSSGSYQHNVLYDSFSNFYYQPFWRGDSLFLKEYRLAGKDTIYKRIEKVDYIVGSGHHTNSHIQNTNGYLYQMPFTFYTQKQVLSLPPGFEKGQNSRFGRALGLECLSCHNAYPQHVKGSINKFEKIPLGIDCERCHGPGEAHVSLKQKGEVVDVSRQIDYSIVNPAKLPYEKQKDVCQRCHLQGNALLNQGHDWTDFKPGMDLNEVVNVFMPRLKNEEGTFIMASHPDRLRLSKCFTESAKNAGNEALTCITCHNPHQSVRQTKAELFNAKCMNCHQNKVAENNEIHNEKAECTACHMRKSGTVDIPHVTVTDHYIRVYNEDEKQADAADAQDFVGLVCLTQKHPQPAFLARAYLNFYEKFDRKTAFIDSAKKYLDQLPEENYAEVWIQYYFLTQKMGALKKFANDKFKNPDFDAQTLYRLASAFGGQQRVKLLEIAVEKAPYRLDLRNELAKACLMQNEVEKALQQVDFVLKEYPKDEEAWNNKGFCLLLKEQINLAEACFAKTLKLNPDHLNAMLNMAKVQLYKNDLYGAKKWTERALNVDPENREARTLYQQISKNLP
ncbi:pilus assembly protein TadD [bacterium]|nr:pilus assembly protein TadD [bacterium]